MIKPTKKNKQRKKNSHVAQALMALLMAVLSLSTDAFGAAPPSQFSEEFRNVIGESFDPEVVGSVNEYLNSINAASIPVRQTVDTTEKVSSSLFSERFLELLNEILPPEIFEYINDITSTSNQFADAETPSIEVASTQSPEELAQELLSTVRTQEALATASLTSAQQTATALSSPTSSVFPTLTSELTQTPATSPTVIWYSWTPIPTKKPNRRPSCTSINPSSPQTLGVVNIDISTLCTDPDGDAWTLSSVTQGTSGSTTFGTRSISYDPNNGFAGADNLTFTISDGQGGTYTQSFNVNISNSPPIANVDTASTAKNNASAIAISVLTNDSDPGGDTLAITVASSTSGATASVVGATVEYTPPTGFSGNDSFSYTIQDTHGGTATGSVSVTVNNSPPTCPSLLTSTMQTTGSVPVDLSSWCSDPNGDTYTITAASSVNGDGVATHSGTTHLYYDPNDGFAGIDQVSYTLDDGDTDGSASFSLTMKIGNLAPNAAADAATVAQDSGATLIDVLANDTDPGNDTLTITNLAQGANGTVTLSAGNTSLTYTPDAGFSGADSFTYSATDPHGGVSASTTVSVTVTPATTAIVCDQANTAGCIINHIQFNGNLATSIYVQPNEVLQLGIGAQGWDTICPLCSYSFAFGIESTMLGCANPLTMSYISTGSYITASTTPGTYNIYANINENFCDYLNPSTSVAQVHVCAPVTMQFDTGWCYTGPSTSYPQYGWMANTTAWRDMTAQNSDYGSLFYEVTSPSWSCWMPATDVLGTQGDPANCLPYKAVAPPPSTHITMYNAGTQDGDMGGRTGADALCAGSRPAGYTKSNAFISAGSGYAIADIPSNYSVPTNIAIKSIGGTTIANDWTSLLGGSILVSMQGAGVVPTSTHWWTGTENSDGTIVPGTSACSEWTQATGWGGNYGSTTDTYGPPWMNLTNQTCDQLYYLLCIAYP